MHHSEKTTLPKPCDVKRRFRQGCFFIVMQFMQQRPCAAAHTDCSEEIGMLIRRRFLAAIQAVCVADPVGSVHIDAAPLVAPLILIDMLVRNPKHVQAQAGRTGAAGARGYAQHQIAVRVVIVRLSSGIRHAAVEHLPECRGNPDQLVFPAQGSEGPHQLDRCIIRRLKFRIRAASLEAGQILKLIDRHRYKRLFLQRDRPAKPATTSSFPPECWTDRTP